MGNGEWEKPPPSRPRESPIPNPMKEKKAYPLRINADVQAAVQAWADDELRSVNAQIEYVLRAALRKAGRLSPAAPAAPEIDEGEDENAQ